MMRAITVILALASWPLVSVAQVPAPAAPDPAALFDEGVLLCQEGRYAEAIERFRVAQAISPHSITLENIALCAEAAGDLVRALEAYEALETDADVRRSATRAGQIARSLERLRARVGRVRVVSQRQGATIRVDGVDVGVAPLHSPIRVTAGHHAIEARAGGHEPGHTVVDVAAGTILDVVVNVGAGQQAPPGRTAQLSIDAPSDVQLLIDGEPVEGPVALSVGRHRVEAVTDDGARFDERIDLGERGRRGRIRVGTRMSWLVPVGAAALAVVAGAVALVTWSSALDAQDRYNDPTTPLAQRASIRDDALAAGRATDALVGLAGVATAATAVLGVLFTLDRKDVEVRWEADQ